MYPPSRYTEIGTDLSWSRIPLQILTGINIAENTHKINKIDNETVDETGVNNDQSIMQQ